MLKVQPATHLTSIIPTLVAEQFKFRGFNMQGQKLLKENDEQLNCICRALNNLRMCSMAQTTNTSYIKTNETIYVYG